MDWSKFKRGVFHVIILAVIHRKKDNKILIVRRKPEDPHIKALTWQFPGGALDYNVDIENHLKQEVKKKTGIKIKVKEIIHARTYEEKAEFLSIYYSTLAESQEVKLDKATYVDYKWIKPSDITKYFTTSYGDKILNFLKELS